MLFWGGLAADIYASAFTAATDQTLTKTPLAFKLSHSVATLHCQGRPVSVAINRLKQLRACDLLAFKLFNASTA